ncbi:uracil phosphoribosyltransferase-domain-containing protein [Hypoxylon sp. FL1857]|nr:uracil phosphoribosyltransferase-domain-containing protein [Hypoxylon sp. FL1857]
MDTGATSPPIDMQNTVPPITSSAVGAPISSKKKPVVIGIYGLPGSGKSFLLNKLKYSYRHEEFEFYEGSELIGNLVPGGLQAFQKLDKKNHQDFWRKLAIDKVGQDAAESGKTIIIAGHLMFWQEGEKEGVAVYTQNDLHVYTHILYLDTSPELIAARLREDTTRSRPVVSVDHLCKWQDTEKRILRQLCYSHGLLFLPVSPTSFSLRKGVSMLIHDFHKHTEEGNLRRAELQLDQIILTKRSKPEVMVVIDGDKTLAPEDTGALFWRFHGKLRGTKPEATEQNPLELLFNSPLGYSYTAFFQASLLYEETFVQERFEDLCAQVASATTPYHEVVEFIRLAKREARVGVIVMTCGPQRIWENILSARGLLDGIDVLGSGCVTNGLIVTPTVKASLVARLRGVHDLSVCALGDSPLDLPMLKMADRAIVVVGDEKTRSKSMDSALLDAIDDGLEACQFLPRITASPRLDTTKLPVIQSLGSDFIESLIGTSSRDTEAHSAYPHTIQIASMHAARLLMTPTRTAGVEGHLLRQAHSRVGWYLAVHHLTKILGLERNLIPHVEHYLTDGYSLRHEGATLIVALMRGGEPMALGISEVFPHAIFLHAFRPDDITNDRLTQSLQVVLVDAVIHSGKTMMGFVQHIRKINAAIPIVMTAGVVQYKTASEGAFAQMLESGEHLSLVALRFSENAYVGMGATDTGNRLFNTTDLS